METDNCTLNAYTDFVLGISEFSRHVVLNSFDQYIIYLNAAWLATKATTSVSLSRNLKLPPTNVTYCNNCQLRSVEC